MGVVEQFLLSDVVAAHASSSSGWLTPTIWASPLASRWSPVRQSRAASRWTSRGTARGTWNSNMMNVILHWLISHPEASDWGRTCEGLGRLCCRRATSRIQCQVAQDGQPTGRARYLCSYHLGLFFMHEYEQPRTRSWD